MEKKVYEKPKVSTIQQRFEELLGENRRLKEEVQGLRKRRHNLRIQVKALERALNSARLINNLLKERIYTNLASSKKNSEPEIVRGEAYTDEYPVVEYHPVVTRIIID